ncbi:hypothetical protein GGH94_003153 [Coemansia aciculifera]|uniref:Uncharacterized protein n=1 Tax=Coemansia aciculifera TaxID=417176 RepID=A0A9W8IMR5_9FUNG|nr:hypothetical protein GGH94_003153 [Coemansia aciculifera]
MASSRSPFQTLPMFIVYKVIEYLEGRRRTSFNADIDEHNETKSVLTPLLSVSEHWRMAALDSICDNCKFDFDAKRESVEVTYPAWPADFSYPRFRKNHLVKRVVVVATLWADLYVGKFCEVIAKPQYESLMFSSATTLVLHLSNSAVNSSRSSSCDYSCNDLSAWCLFFLTKSRNIVREGSTITEGSTASRLISGGLYVFSKRNDSPISFNLSAVSGLTSITQGPNISCAPFAKLAYLNASTLKALGLRLANKTEWTNVIYGGTTASASYTSLASLTLAISGISYSIIWAAIKDIAPFPVLLTLDISGGYPFDDDLLFRGNGGTMKSLRIPFSAIARNALDRFGVLKRSGVTRMTRVCIDEVTDLDKEYMTRRTDVPIKQQVHHMLEVALALRLWNDTTAFGIFCAVHAAPSTAVLRCLEFGNVRVYTDSIIQFISVIPSLVSLTCIVCGLGPTIESIAARDRPSRLCSKYVPLSKNFRKLGIPYTADTSAEQATYAAMFFVILCPNFTLLDISPKLRDPFSREVAWAAFNCPFEAYADSLRRLIYRK